jgi:hypothetical protein
MSAELRTPIHDGAIRRLHRYGGSRLGHKHLGHRSKSRGAPVFPTGSLGQCLCSTCRGGWLHHFRVVGQVRPSLFHPPSTKLTPLCEGPPKCGLTLSLCATSWATRNLCGRWYQWRATSISLVRSFSLLAFSYIYQVPCLRLCRQNNKTLAAT